ncbi:MAG: methyl-accepting chemotaxis protein [Acidimicrobiales bacterium]
MHRHVGELGARRSGRPTALVRRFGLRTKLLGVLVLVGVIPFALVSWEAVHRVRQADVTSARSELEAAAVSAGELIDRNLFERYGDAQAFAVSPAVRRSPAAAAEVTDTLMELYGVYDLMVVTDADGVVVAVNSVDHAGHPAATEGLLGRDLSSTSWFGAMRDGSGAADGTFAEPATRSGLVDEVYGDNRMTLPFTALITGPDGSFAGVWHNEASFERVVGDIAAATQVDLQSSGAATADVEVLAGRELLADEGSPRSAGQGQVRVLPDGLDQAPGASGHFTEAGHGEQRMLTGYAVTDGALGFPGYGWTILISQEYSSITAGADELRRALQLIGLVLTGAIALVSYLLARRLSRPMGHAVGMALGAASDLKVVADGLMISSQDVSQRASDIAVSTEQLNTGISVIAAAVEELNGSFAEVARNATEASSFAEEAVTVAERSTESVTELGRSSEAIDRVLGIIRSLAEQTNMLALNASIEASRAGVAGRGFAIVAESVKELAEGTARATHEIGDLVGRIQGDVSRAIEANGSIKEAVDRIRGYSVIIAEATDEQSGTASDVARITASATHDANEIATSNVVLAEAAERSWAAANSMQTSAEAVAGMASELTAVVFGEAT